MIDIDFETYYSKQYSLKRMTAEEYVRDPRFQVLGIGVSIDGARPVWLEDWEFREWAKSVNWGRAEVCAHHAHFDGLVLSHHYGIRPGRWWCTLSMGRALHDRSRLADLAKSYALGTKGDVLGSVLGLRREQLTHTGWLALGEYCRNDVVLMRRVRAAMMADFSETELALIDLTVRCFTEPQLRADVGVLHAALAEERKRKAEFFEKLNAQCGGDARATLASARKFADLLQSVGVDPPTKTGKRGEIFAFAKSDAGMQALLDHPDDQVRFLAEARLAVKSTIVETRAERLLGVASRGAIPVYLKYCGAHTHRWSGGDRSNFQNFNRGGVLRDAIEAPDGHVLVAVDSMQIEARGVAWLAGESTLLTAFRRNDETGGDFYSDVGSGFFGKPLSKKDTPLERHVSKTMVLGLGYGMGWLKFALNLASGAGGVDAVQFTATDAQRYGVDPIAFASRSYGTGECFGDMVSRAVSRLSYDALLTHCAVADYFVRQYRERNAPRIPALWRTCERLIEAMASGQHLEFQGLRVSSCAIRKPGGLVLRYPGLRRTGTGWSYVARHSGRVHMYGGKLTENLVQSLARDVVAGQAASIARRYRVVTTTHDEIVCVVPEQEGKEALDFMVREMRRAPTWAPDWPLNASGAVARRYGDCK